MLRFATILAILKMELPMRLPGILRPAMDVECAPGEVAAMGLLNPTVLKAAVLADAHRAAVRIVVPVPAELVEDPEEVHHQR